MNINPSCTQTGVKEKDNDHENANGKGPTRTLRCPENPNCVSTEATDNQHKIDGFRLKGECSKKWGDIQRVVVALPKSTVAQADETYLQAAFKSRAFRFIDVLELFLNPSSGVISIRSAAQSGYWDFGVNRRRVEQLRQTLQANGLIDQS